MGFEYNLYQQSPNSLSPKTTRSRHTGISRGAGCSPARQGQAAPQAALPLEICLSQGSSRELGQDCPLGTSVCKKAITTLVATPGCSWLSQY